MQENFVEQLTSSGVVLCLAPQWVEQLYGLVLANDLLSRAGHTAEPVDIVRNAEQHSTKPVLVELLQQTSDLLAARCSLLLPAPPENGGSNGKLSEEDDESSDDDTVSRPAQLMQFKEVRPPISSLVELRIRQHVCRQLLETNWEPVIEVLHQPLSGHVSPKTSQTSDFMGYNTSQASVAMLKSSPSKAPKSPEAETLSCLQGFRCLARLTCTLGMRLRCAEVLATLESAACRDVFKVNTSSMGTNRSVVSSHPSSGAAAGLLTSGFSSLKQKIIRKPGSAGSDETSSSGSGLPDSSSGDTRAGKQLQLSHVLCMEALLSLGLQSAVHAPQCWQHVLRLVAFCYTLRTRHVVDKQDCESLNNATIFGKGLVVGVGLESFIDQR